MDESFREYTSRLLRKYWHDPVWSMVIAAGIIAIASSVLTLIWAFVKSYFESISLGTAIKQILTMFAASTSVSNYLIFIFFLLFIFLLWNFTTGILHTVRQRRIDIKNKPDAEESDLPRISQQSTVFFSYRLGKAFPGQRGLQWYESKTAVERLRILLKEPLRFQSNNIYGVMSDPIWWFRGSGSLSIDSFRILNKTKILLDVEELEIKRIAVFSSERYKRCFIYVETNPEIQTGLYNFTPEDISCHVETYGYSREECGLYGKHYIRREEYDDGAALIKGKVVETWGAKLRIRFLSNYNFIIAAKQSPYNQQSFYRNSEPY